jgi:FKBP-type peptidyl-prolyl cis-trans isomerase
VPPAMAYGATGSGSIPPNSNLVFEVELANVQ